MTFPHNDSFVRRADTLPRDAEVCTLTVCVVMYRKDAQRLFAFYCQPYSVSAFVGKIGAESLDAAPGDQRFGVVGGGQIDGAFSRMLLVQCAYKGVIGPFYAFCMAFTA